MVDIKVKQSKKGTIKLLNKAVVGTEKMKDKLVQAKDKKHTKKKLAIMELTMQ